jgi:hypothetical protein
VELVQVDGKVACVRDAVDVSPSLHRLSVHLH